MHALDTSSLRLLLSGNVRAMTEGVKMRAFHRREVVLSGGDFTEGHRDRGCTLVSDVIEAVSG